MYTKLINCEFTFMSYSWGKESYVSNSIQNQVERSYQRWRKSETNDSREVRLPKNKTKKSIGRGNFFLIL